MSCFWKHKWSKWKTIGEYDIVRHLTKTLVGQGLLQSRECEQCGEVSTRTEKVYL